MRTRERDGKSISEIFAPRGTGPRGGAPVLTHLRKLRVIAANHGRHAKLEDA